ncbi:MAG: acyl-CoA thioesterase [Pirellulales bacterium]|nr:acyl-CoA thioesterase [Pirellulales bacterium]
MADTYRSKRLVEWHDTDAAQIAHFTAFFRYMEEVEHEYLRSLGLSVLMHDAEGPMSWPRVSVDCRYIGAVRFEDEIDILLEVVRLGSKSVTYRFGFTHAGRPVAEGSLTSVCCRILPDGTPRGIAIPEAIAAKFGVPRADERGAAARAPSE